MARYCSRKSVVACSAAVLSLALAAPAHAVNLNWKGLDWTLTDGGMAGVAEGSSANISVDGNGYLHLRIVKNGNTWTASEMFTTQNLGFGSYQWQIDGPVDVFDKQVVLGLFPYGPAAGIGGDGTNEIDIEWARWGQADGVNIGFTDYPDSGNTIGTMSYTVSLGGGTASTARFVWTSQFIDNSILKGYQPLGSDAQLIHRWKYAPNNPGTNIPQQALPLGMNLWCFEAPPSDGQNVEIVIRDFQFVKEGDPIPNGGSGGMGGMGSGGMAGAGGKPSIGGNGNGGNGNGGAGPKGGASSGGTANNAGTGSGGISTGGTSNGVPAGGGAQSGGTASNNGGTTSNNGGTSSLPSAGSTSASAGSTNATNNDAADSSSGCACHVAGHRSSSAAIAAFLGLTLLTLRRRIAPA